MPKAARLSDIASSHECFPDTPVIEGSPDVFFNGLPAARQGDTVQSHTCTCPNTPHGTHSRTIASGSASVLINGKPAARIGDDISCGGVLSTGSGNIIIGDTPYVSPVHECGVQQAKRGAPLVALSPMLTMTPVFAKSTLRGEGCTSAGEEEETHHHFAPVAFYCQPEDSDEEPEQHAQSAKKPRPLEKLAGSAQTTGSWSIQRDNSPTPVRLGMMSGKLTPQEAGSDFLDKARLTRIAAEKGSAPTRVRYRWEEQSKGEMLPVGFHTAEESGQDQVPVRLMNLSASGNQYEYTTEGPFPVTLYWSAQEPMENRARQPNANPAQTIPADVAVKVAESAKALEGFDDIILIVPVEGVPPVYLFLGQRHEITLTIGVFFDGTGNNAINTAETIRACSNEAFNISAVDAASILRQTTQQKMGLSGLSATSYTGYYSNVHWLRTLYKTQEDEVAKAIQKAIYVEGIGTKAGEADATIGMGLGRASTGVIAKTDDAINMLPDIIAEAIDKLPHNITLTVQFDVFGFSRGAAAARHFTNRVKAQDPALLKLIQTGLKEQKIKGKTGGKVRFLGIFDTVAAIGDINSLYNPNSADTGSVNIALPAGIAEHVFHIRAQHECRYNFAANSVAPAWPEVVLPGVHSDIGGGYLPLEEENLFLTRPRVETISASTPAQQTRVYRETVNEIRSWGRAISILPILRSHDLSIETWDDDRMPPDRYGEMQKRCFAAITLRKRLVKNDWSKVALRVMLDAAIEAGVDFNLKNINNIGLELPDELLPLCDKALAIGKASRTGKTIAGFTSKEIELIGKDYIHMSANWNAIALDEQQHITGGAQPLAVLAFTNRPDNYWARTVYNMDGKKK